MVLVNWLNFPLFTQDLPNEVKEAQQKKLEELKKQQETQNRLAVERKIFLRNRKIRFFGNLFNHDQSFGLSSDFPYLDLD